MKPSEIIFKEVEKRKNQNWSLPYDICFASAIAEYLDKEAEKPKYVCMDCAKIVNDVCCIGSLHGRKYLVCHECAFKYAQFTYAPKEEVRAYKYPVLSAEEAAEQLKKKEDKNG